MSVTGALPDVQTLIHETLNLDHQALRRFVVNPTQCLANWTTRRCHNRIQGDRQPVQWILDNPAVLPATYSDLLCGLAKAAFCHVHGAHIRELAEYCRVLEIIDDARFEELLDAQKAIIAEARSNLEKIEGISESKQVALLIPCFETLSFIASFLSTETEGVVRIGCVAFASVGASFGVSFWCPKILCPLKSVCRTRRLLGAWYNARLGLYSQYNPRTGLWEVPPPRRFEFQAMREYLDEEETNASTASAEIIWIGIILFRLGMRELRRLLKRTLRPKPRTGYKRVEWTCVGDLYATEMTGSANSRLDVWGSNVSRFQGWKSGPTKLSLREFRSCSTADNA